MGESPWRDAESPQCNEPPVRMILLTDTLSQKHEHESFIKAGWVYLRSDSGPPPGPQPAEAPQDVLNPSVGNESERVACWACWGAGPHSVDAVLVTLREVDRYLLVKPPHSPSVILSQHTPARWPVTAQQTDYPGHPPTSKSLELLVSLIIQ
ncbi:hypothetical protein MHYP_G00128260 [Metynnis hypsauchen]